MHSDASATLGRHWARAFVDRNLAASDALRRALDDLAPRDRGWTKFVTDELPSALAPGLRVLDVGGGKRPQVAAADKARLGLHVTGLDIDAHELAQAPEGAYDRIIVGDVATASLDGSFDLIVSCAVLEHVQDTAGAIANLASALAPGGTMLHFIPGGLAPFALVNRALGPSLSRKVLFALYPDKSESQGFAAYYDRCTPTAMTSMAEAEGLVDVEVTPYFASDYLRAFAPAYAAEAARQLIVKQLGLRNLAESFCFRATSPR